MICIYQIGNVVVNYFKYETTTNVIVKKSPNSYVMPTINIKVDKVNPIDISCYIKLMNNSEFISVFVAVSELSDELIYNFEYTRWQTKRIYYLIDRPEYILDPGADTWPLITLGGYSHPRGALAVQNYGGYQAKLGQKTYEGLSAPYEEACYHEADNDFANHIFERQDSCFLECVELLLKERHNCSYAMHHLYFMKNSTCLRDVQKDLCDWNETDTAQIDVRRPDNTCRKKCPRPCRKFEYSIKKFRIDKTFLKETTAVAMQRVVVLCEFEENDFVIVFKSIPRMILFDLFYEICSLASLWVGFSILNISFKFL